MNYDLSKIRIKCAEIVGWKRTALPTPLIGAGDTFCTWTHPTLRPIDDEPGFDPWHAELSLPNYPESADAALQLVAWLEKQGWDVHVFFEGGNCSIELLSHSEIPIISSEAKTFPLVACLSFLKANNIDPETL